MKALLRRWLPRVLWATAILAICLGLGAWLYVERLRATLPELPDLQELRPAYGTQIKSAQGLYLGGADAIEPVAYQDLPPLLVAAFLAAEDEDFFHHRGYQVRSIVRAALANYRAGETVQGASTITQQVAKYFLAPEQTWRRKFREFLLAQQVEANYSKEEILAAYLGGVYFGQQAWGVTMASHTYFSRPPDALELSQMATLAGVLPAPSDFNPIDNPDLARRERDRVLRRMHDMAMISPRQFEAAIDAPIEGENPVAPAPSVAPEAVGTVQRQWDILGDGRDWERSDLQVFTTIEPGHQVRARQALMTGVEAEDRRRGWQGPQGRVADRQAFDQALDDQANIAAGQIAIARVAAVDDEQLTLRVPGAHADIGADQLRWVRGRHPRTDEPRISGHWRDFFSVDDVIFVRRHDEDWQLWQSPLQQGAMVVTDHHSGAVLASIGAYDIDRSSFHRGEQACRQPGSLFKTVLFAEAFSRDITAATLLSDVPTDVATGRGVWQPRNADFDFRGYLTAIDAYAMSRNIPAANLLQHLGYEPVVERARAMGIQSLLDPTPALALGANCLRLTEMVDVHQSIARQGQVSARHSLSYVRDGRTGRISDHGAFLDPTTGLIPRVVRAARRPQPARFDVEPPVSYLVLEAMRAAVTRGTAHELPDDWPLAAKTGTSDQFDAWVAVISPQKTAVVWVGSDQNDQPFARGEHGGTVALPIFAQYYDGLAPEIDTWPPPPAPDWDLEQVRIDSNTGLLARPGQPGLELPFLEGTAPVDFAPTQASRQLESFDSLMR